MTQAQTQAQQPAKAGSNSWFVLSLLAVVVVTAGVLWYVNTAAPMQTTKTGPLPDPVTGRVVAPLVGPLSDPAGVSIAALVQGTQAYAGQRVALEGRLGHRERTGYGWNLKFDLFDAAGNSVRLLGVPAGTPAEKTYRAVGTVRAGAYGPELVLESIVPA